MIVNLMGPPASGKSTFAAHFILNHPYYQYCSIDNYRLIHPNETLAWKNLAKDILQVPDVVIESVGLGWRLVKVLAQIKRETKHSIISIALTGDPDIFARRLAERQINKPLPPQYRSKDELDTIYWVVQHLDDSPIRIDKQYDSSILSSSDIYELITKDINIFRATSCERLKE